jgi:hypothetical protein
VLVQPLMRPRRVEVAHAVLLEYLLEMPLAKNHHVVEAFAPAAPEEPLAHGIHERSTNSRPKHANRGAPRRAIKVGAELAVVVADEGFWPGSWIDIQKARATLAAAHAAFPAGKTCRVVEITERSRWPLPT